MKFFCPHCSLTQTFLSLHCLWISDEMSGCCSWHWQRQWWWWGRKLSAHSLRVPPAPTTIICLTGSKSPPSQIFTGCWFHSVTVTIWSLHGGLISRTRPIRKLSASCVRHVNCRQKCTRTHGQTRTHALDLCLCAVMCLFNHAAQFTFRPRLGSAESRVLMTLAEGSVKWLCDCWLLMMLSASRQKCEGTFFFF